MPWAIEYLHDEYVVAGVPDACESSGSPSSDLKLGLDFISKESTWIYRFKDSEDQFQVREFVVPRRKRSAGTLSMLAPDEYEASKARVKRALLEWAEACDIAEQSSDGPTMWP